MTRTCNLNAARDARVATAASVLGSRCSRKKEQAPRRASSQISSKRSQTPSGAPPSGIKVSTGIAQSVVPPPVSSQDGANQEVKTMVQDIVLPDTAWGDSAGCPYSASGTIFERASGTPSNRGHFF